MSDVAIDIQKIQNILKSKERNPIVVSIGPCHHGKQELQVMEKIKWNCLDHVLKVNSQHTLDDYMTALLKAYPFARSYYAKELTIETKKFVKMMLLDGCFILSYLCGADWSMDAPSSIPDRWEYNFVTRDILLIENQIPFFILKKICELVMGEEHTSTLLEKTALLVEQILFNYPKSIRESERPTDFHHLLHLCHMYFRPSEDYDVYASHPSHEDQPLNGWHQAMQYQIAGVKFKKREFDKNKPHSLLDVRLCDNLIEIPVLVIDESTNDIFRDLIMFERTNPQFGNYIISYIIFMSLLVSTSNDVALLVNKGIIEHPFERDEQVLDIFTELTEGLDFDFSSNYYLKKICQSMEAYYQRWMKSWKGWLRCKIYDIRNWI